jgi:hypothetical protein
MPGPVLILCRGPPITVHHVWWCSCASLCPLTPCLVLSHLQGLASLAAELAAKGAALEDAEARFAQLEALMTRIAARSSSLAQIPGAVGALAQLQAG